MLCVGVPHPLYDVVALEKALVLDVFGGNSCGTTLERIQVANPCGLVCGCWPKVAELVPRYGLCIAKPQAAGKIVGTHGRKLFVAVKGLGSGFVSRLTSLPVALNSREIPPERQAQAMVNRAAKVPCNTRVLAIVCCERASL